jgi:beta-lactamase regulating signal transducer with metallopeptidase domain
MIAPWLLYSLVIGAAVSIAAVAAERLARAWRVPGRWVWVAAIVATTLAPLAAYLLGREPAGGANVADPGTLQPVVLAAWEIAARESRRVGVDAFLLGAWAAASLLLLARVVAGALMLRRRSREWARRVVDGTPVLVSPGIGPAVAGVWPARIILPRWVLDLDASARALVVSHEREHCRARDTIPIYLATLLCAVLPWNVALWWQMRRLRLAIEVDCDERVLRGGSEPDAYGELLVDIAVRRGGAWPAITPALSEPISFLERRIDAMTSRPNRTALLTLVAAAALIAAVVVACAAPSPTNANPDADDAPAKTTVGGVAVKPAPDGKPRVATPPYFEFQVEKPVTVAAGNASPRYPDLLRSAKVEGEVLAQFVVDTMGHAELSTFKVLKTSHDLFTAAVKGALPNMQFRAAEVGGRKVKQLVQMPFNFSLSKDAPKVTSRLQIP